MYFMLFFKKLLIIFVGIEYIDFTNISLFCMLHLLLFGENPQPCITEKIVKNCVYEALLLFFFTETLQIICIC